MLYTVCVFSEANQMGSVYETFEHDGDFAEELKSFLAKRDRLQGGLSDKDKLFARIFDEKTVIPVAVLKKVMRLLRAYDEVGIANDVHDIFEQISDERHIVAVGVGDQWINRVIMPTDRANMADLQKTVEAVL